MKVLDQLFTPFLTTKSKGTGLGLPIVKGIIKGLQGEVVGENHPEGGAMISITLPAHTIPSTLPGKSPTVF